MGTTLLGAIRLDTASVGVSGALALALLGALCLAPAVCAQEPERITETLNDDLRVEQLTGGVWRHVSYFDLETFGRSPGNGLVVVSGSAAALIDTPWTGEQTRDLFRWVEERLAAKITTVVATHSHQDCMGGLAAAHELGARSFASSKTAELARRGGLPVPAETFAEGREIEVGSRTLELHYPGPGHAADNSVVWIPDDRILFGGCAVRAGAATGLGYTAEADLERWPHTALTLLEAYRDARWVVPGHGPPGGAELLRHTLELLASRRSERP